jgi:hypothetical protein
VFFASLAGNYFGQIDLRTGAATVLEPPCPVKAHRAYGATAHSIRTPPSKAGFARSKAKAMDPEIARNQNYDDHYANDSEDVHSALLPFPDDSALRARSPYVSAAIT